MNNDQHTEGVGTGDVVGLVALLRSGCSCAMSCQCRFVAKDILESDWLAADRAAARAEGARAENQRTLGSLTAGDIGSHVEFWDHAEAEPRFGVLKSVHHHTASGFPSTWVRLAPFDGPFMCRPETPVQVIHTTLAEPAPDTTASEDER